MLTQDPNRMDKWNAFCTDGFDQCSCESSVKLEFRPKGKKWRAHCNTCSTTTEWCSCRGMAMAEWNKIVRSHE